MTKYYKFPGITLLSLSNCQVKKGRALTALPFNGMIFWRSLVLCLKRSPILWHNAMPSFLTRLLLFRRISNTVIRPHIEPSLWGHNAALSFLYSKNHLPVRESPVGRSHTVRNRTFWMQILPALCQDRGFQTPPSMNGRRSLPRSSRRMFYLLPQGTPPARLRKIRRALCRTP